MVVLAEKLFLLASANSASTDLPSLLNGPIAQSAWGSRKATSPPKSANKRPHHAAAMLVENSITFKPSNAVAMSLSPLY